MNPENITKKFLTGKRLKDDEFDQLDKFLNSPQYRREIIEWFEKNWKDSQPEEVSLQFRQIQEKIRKSSLRIKTNRLLTVISKVAAVLFVPLLAGSIVYYVNQNTSKELLSLYTNKGEQTSVILPDGSKAWLNVDSKLSYPVDYGVKSRNLELEGEAYFEVEKNKELPFVVTSGKISTKALGTRFAVSAYPGSDKIKSSLLEGSVEVKTGNTVKILKPGQQLTYDKKKNRTTIDSFNKDYELAWKNNQLAFRFTPFDEVIAKLEEWYDVNIEYNPDSFKSETLTVTFQKYETFEQVLRIISKTNGFKYSVKGRNVIITKNKIDKK